LFPVDAKTTERETCIIDSSDGTELAEKWRAQQSENPDNQRT